MGTKTESERTVAVFGAYGHTGCFLVVEFQGQGHLSLPSGRDTDKLRALTESCPGLDTRRASADDPVSLGRALFGTAAVINCAGPFASTAAPLIEAALRAGIPYVDVAARDLAPPDTPAPTASDARGRSVQTFLVDAVDAVVRSGAEHRAPWRAAAAATSSPRLSRTTGVASADVPFDAPDFLDALSAHLTVTRWRARAIRPS